MNSVAVIDYGMGNLHSVAKALACVSGNARIEVTHDPERILAADRVVLPGVGAIRDCVAELKRLEMDKLIHEVAKSKPLLGVCVGMQVLMDFSEENDGTECLGVLPGRVGYFGDDLKDAISGERLKVPHMGWNQVHQTCDHPLWEEIEQDSRFYFVHSYYLPRIADDMTAARTDYGVNFTSAVVKDNVFAVQFHPEKSAKDGLRLYHNFMQWNGES